MKTIYLYSLFVGAVFAGITYLLSYGGNPLYFMMFLIGCTLGYIRWKQHKIEKHLKEKDEKFKIWD